MEYENYLKNINFAEKAEKSLKEMSNWVFGISLALCSILLFKFNDFEFNDSTKMFYKGIVIYSLFLVFITGLSKYRILKRESKLNIAYGNLLKAFYLLKEKRNETEFDRIWKENMANWGNEHNKLGSVANLVNYSTLFTFLQLILIVIFILCTI
jgi:hypothetical protein